MQTSPVVIRKNGKRLVLIDEHDWNENITKYELMEAFLSYKLGPNAACEFKKWFNPEKPGVEYSVGTFQN
jgi:hypothetical protein